MKKLAIVTGGNRGIGLEICRQLAKTGFKVILGSRKIPAGKQAAEILQREGLDVVFQPLDVNDEEQINFIASWIEMEYGYLDVLVNNAGIGVGSSGIADANIDEIRSIMETNFYGPLRTSKAFISLLRKSDEGKIINVSSGMGSISEMGSGYAGYRISKTALNAQTIMLAQEMSSYGIKVNAISPGWVKSEMGGQNAPRTPEEGADTVIWLATETNIPTGKFFRDRNIIPW